jgi:hypothetical protein
MYVRSKNGTTFHHRSCRLAGEKAASWPWPYDLTVTEVVRWGLPLGTNACKVCDPLGLKADLSSVSRPVGSAKPRPSVVTGLVGSVAPVGSDVL